MAARRSLRKINDEIDSICYEGVDVSDDFENPLTEPIALPEAADIEEQLEALEMARDEKLENIGLFLIDGKAESEKLDAEIKRLSTLKKRLDTRCSWLKHYCVSEMLRAGMKKLKTTFVSLSVRKTNTSATYDKDIEGKPDVDRIDDRFWSQEVVYKVDTRAAIKYNKDTGKAIKGFTFCKDKNHLIIR